MARNNSWAGWIGFAGLLMIVMGTIDFFEGLIAIIRGGYFYQVSAQQIIIFDSKTWGWLTLLWGIATMLIGFGLLNAAGWARWTAIVFGSLSFIEQLGFLGSTPYPIWSLTVIGLTVVVLYALIVRWDEATTMPV